MEKKTVVHDCYKIIEFAVILLVFCYLDTWQNLFEQIWKIRILLTISFQTKKYCLEKYRIGRQKISYIYFNTKNINKKLYSLIFMYINSVSVTVETNSMIYNTRLIYLSLKKT